MPRVKLAQPARFLTIYILAVGLSAELLLVTRGPSPALLLFTAPILLAPLYFPRWIHLAMLGTFGLSSAGVSYAFVGGPSVSIQMTVVLSLVVIAVTELIYRLATERSRMQEALRESRERFHGVFTQSPTGMLLYGADGALLEANRAALAILGVPSAGQLQGLKLFADPSVPAAALAALQRGDPARYEVAIDRERDGQPYTSSEDSRRQVEAVISALDMAGQRRGYVAQLHDISGHKRLEEKLLQVRKMEAVGQVAAGVAHELNNLLTVINGYCAFAQTSLTAGNPVQRDLDRVRTAGERAGELTRQLLAFGRRQRLEVRTFDLNAALEDLTVVLRCMMGANTQIELHLDHGLGDVRADAAQVEQVVLNLATNARDAMPEGGVLRLETGSVELAPEAAGRAGIGPGRYALLRVADTGCGMTPEVQAHLFEPFFTTKEVGRGTGLGLATAHSILERSGGGILVESEPGHGTTFDIYLPLAA